MADFIEIGNPKYLESTHWIHTTTPDRRQFYVLAGVARIESDVRVGNNVVHRVGFQGQSTANWNQAELIIYVPIPELPANHGLKIQSWAPYAALASFYDEAQSINAGFAMDRFGLWQVDSAVPVDRAKIYALLSVRDNDAWIYRVSYHVTLVGEYGPLPPVL